MFKTWTDTVLSFLLFIAVFSVTIVETEVSYSGEYFLKVSKRYGQIIKLEKCRIYGVFEDDPERYYCEEIVSPPVID